MKRLAAIAGQPFLFSAFSYLFPLSSEAPELDVPLEDSDPVPPPFAPDIPLLVEGDAFDVPVLSPVPVAPPVLPTPVQFLDVSRSEVAAPSPRTLEFNAELPPSVVTR
ncbi:hypothetical protein RY831_31485 [Noviherbaspirillum sp. CPCC 100848]|uniref:Secreted protein n=1 Tax=Noviherbaspirillum album TaxID=3080276 RepID=A0ABU6JIX5_9BURK|nr:hypothetical protein [Noviherbaspirillum sp. CPCC 100848]MEC4723650.1 hypothetical protein [Noviherbaspirillum sp. CPCC 100848]